MTDHHVIDTSDDDSVREAADYVERELTDLDDCIVLPILHGTPAVHREDLIDHHQRVRRAAAT